MEQEEEKTQAVSTEEKAGIPEETEKAEAEEEATEAQGTESGAKAEAENAETGKKAEMPKDERSRQAEMRRLNDENARLKRQLEQYRTAREGAVSDTALQELGLTKDDLKDSENLALAEDYMAGLAKGEKDPALYAFRKAKMRANEAKKEADAKAKAETEAKERQTKAVEADAKEFARLFPNVDIGKVTSPDSDFMRKHGNDANLMGNVTGTYAKYLQEKENERRTTETAKQMANPPTGGQQGTESGDDALPDPSWSWEDFRAWQRKHGV